MEFFNDPEQNLYSFAICERFSNGTFRVKIDDSFPFDIFTDFTISSSDDLLVDFCKTVNSRKYSDLTALLLSCNLAYESLMGIGETSPVEILELDAEDNRDNDINDIKFIDRVRFREGDFNADLFFNAFEYCEPKDIVRFGRVSKAWYVLANNETLWKGICTRMHLENPDEYSWKSLYLNTFAMPYNWIIGSRGAEYSLVVSDKTLTRTDFTGKYWVSARIDPGCTPGAKMTFAVKINECSQEAGFFTFGVIDQSWDVDQGESLKNSSVNGSGTVVVPYDTGLIFGMEIDRTKEDPTIRIWQGFNQRAPSDCLLNKDHTWFPCVSMVYSNSCTIERGWEPPEYSEYIE
jgi:hypothetical protein